jgi:hypothetical protein
LTTAGDDFYWTEEPWGRALRSRHLGTLADHFFTSRQLRLRGPDEEAHWETIAQTIGVGRGHLVQLEQIHGRDAVVVRRGDAAPPSAPRRADIILTNDPGVAIVVQVADCVPLLLADPASGAVAAVHAGWRGTQQAAAVAGVAALREAFGSRPEDLIVAHGPSIGPCCYTVGDEVEAAFRENGFGRSMDAWFSHQADGSLRLDLWSANRDQLIHAGVRPEAIHQSRLCTFCRPEAFHSYRRDGKGTGRIAAVIRARA